MCGVFIQTYVLREKSKVLQPCTVYILKKQSFVCFYYFNYCYKKPAIFNMWFGEFCLFFLFGGFLCFSRFCFFLVKKKNQPASSVCAAAGQDIKMLKFLLENRRAHLCHPTAGLRGTWGWASRVQSMSDPRAAGAELL